MNKTYGKTGVKKRKGKFGTSRKYYRGKKQVEEIKKGGQVKRIIIKKKEKIQYKRKNREICVEI